MQVASFSMFVSRFEPSQYPAISAPFRPHHALGQAIVTMEAQDFVAKIHRLAEADRVQIGENDGQGFKV